MADLADLKELFARGTVAGPVDSALIAQAERTLGVRFPRDYRTFLASYGAAFGPGYEIAGLVQRGNDPPSWLDAVEFTLQNRGAPGDVPEGYVAIASDGGDYVYYLDTRAANERGETPVVIFGPGYDGARVGLARGGRSL